MTLLPIDFMKMPSLKQLRVVGEADELISGQNPVQLVSEKYAAWTKGDTTKAR